MKRLDLVAYSAALAATTVYAAPSAIDTIAFYARPAVNIVCLWFLWLVATLAPLALSAIAWMIAQKYTLRWFPHLIFVPVAIIVYPQGMSLFLRVSGLAVHDGLAGDASELGSLYLLVTLLVHLLAFTTAAIASVKGQTYVR
ncbi:hypothetical protein [Rhizorhabdus sp. FW153]|uniref:hypothetical protein n=1 Tax=Rhizorhabdus sp. FW153 TaxID=3400216 RepID=UPI003CFA1497